MASKKNNRYRNPANDLVDYVESGAKGTLKRIRDAAQRSAEGWQSAANGTGERLKEETSKDRSSRAEAIRSRQPTPPAPKPTAKPKPKGMSNIPPKESNAPVNVAARKPKPVPTEQRTTTKPSTTSKPSTTPKPVPKSSSKPVSKTSETYKDGGKGLYQGSQEYRDKIGGSGNPLLNRLRRDMGRDEKTGEKPNAIPKNDSPASKRGSTSPSSASKPMTGGSSFNTRGMFDKDKKKKNRPGSSYA